MRKEHLLLIIMIISLLTGCWDFRQIDNTYIVTGIAIEKDPTSENLEVSVKIPIPSPNLNSSMAYTKKASIISRKGNTMFNAIDKMEKEMKKELYLGHLQMVIISEDVAREKIYNILDTLSRNAHLKRSVYIVMSKIRPKEVLAARTDLDISPITDLANMFEINKTNEFIPTTLDEFTSSISGKTSDGMLPIIEMNNEIITASGMAIFKGGKYIGEINGEEIRVLSLLLYPEFTSEYYTVKGLGYNKDPDDLLTIQTKTGSGKIKVTLKDKQIEALLHIKLTGRIAEHTDNHPSMSDEETYMFAAKQLKRLLQSNLESLIHNSKGYNADIMEIGKYVKAKYPDYWNTIDWQETYKQVKFIPKIEVEIKSGTVTMINVS
ncbi:Ger(x)C family spore germination protein [Anaerosolibacter sp.]|uniref:Ger(x)C family spore germination protein n=1 Tax=Anaerosolibacter sp. TaxID=1872527 RepID=UPI0039F14210